MTDIAVRARLFPGVDCSPPRSTAAPALLKGDPAVGTGVGQAAGAIGRHATGAQPLSPEDLYTTRRTVSDIDAEIDAIFPLLRQKDQFVQALGSGLLLPVDANRVREKLMRPIPSDPDHTELAEASSEQLARLLAFLTAELESSRPPPAATGEDTSGLPENLDALRKSLDTSFALPLTAYFQARNGRQEVQGQ